MVFLKWVFDLLILSYLEFHYILFPSLVVSKYKKSRYVRQWIYTYWCYNTYKNNSIDINSKYLKYLAMLSLSNNNEEIRTYNHSKRMYDIIAQISTLDNKNGYLCLTGIDNFNNKVIRYICNYELYEKVKNMNKYTRKLKYIYLKYFYYIFYNDPTNIVGVDYEILKRDISIPVKYNKALGKVVIISSVFELKYSQGISSYKIDYDLIKYFIIRQNRNNYINYFLHKDNFKNDKLFLKCGYKLEKDNYLGERVFVIFGKTLKPKLSYKTYNQYY